MPRRHHGDGAQQEQCARRGEPQLTCSQCASIASASDPLPHRLHSSASLCSKASCMVGLEERPTLMTAQFHGNARRAGTHEGQGEVEACDRPVALRDRLQQMVARGQGIKCDRSQGEHGDCNALLVPGGATVGPAAPARCAKPDARTRSLLSSIQNKQ